MSGIIKYGGDTVNKKLILNTLIFAGVGALFFIITYILNRFGVISGQNKIINAVIFAISCVIGIYYYFYINKEYSHDSETIDCVLIFIIAVVFSWITLCLSLEITGVCLSVSVTWACELLLIFADNVLERLSSPYSFDSEEKNRNSVIITNLKEWRFALVICGVVFGVVNIIMPLKFSYNPFMIF